MLEDAPVLPSGRRSTPGMLGVVMSVLLSGRRYDRIHQSGSLPRRPTRWTPLERIHQSGSLPRRPTRWTPLERLHQSGSLPSCLTRWTLLERIHQSGSLLRRLTRWTPFRSDLPIRFFGEASYKMDAVRTNPPIRFLSRSVFQDGRNPSQERPTKWTLFRTDPPIRFFVS